MLDIIIIGLVSESPDFVSYLRGTGCWIILSFYFKNNYDNKNKESTANKSPVGI